MSNDLSMRVTMDTVRPSSPPRDTNGQIKADSQQEKSVSVAARGDILVNENDAPAESRVVQKVESSLLKKVLDDLTQHARNISRDLQFSIDEDLGRTVITVIDSQTDEVVRQIPTEDALALARQLMDDESSVILDVKV